MNVDDIPIVSGATRLGHIDELRDDRFRFFDRLNRECGDIGRALALGTSLIFANVRRRRDHRLAIRVAMSLERP